MGFTSTYVEFLFILNEHFVTFILAINSREMKKLLPFILIVLLVMSCKNDDDATVAQCSDPTNLNVDDLTLNSATISWTDANNAASFRVEYGLSGFNPGSGTTTEINELSVSITGLLSSTEYDVYIEALCSATNQSMQVGPLSFTTKPPLVLPEFTQNLSDMNLFTGDMSDLNITEYAFEYELITPLFTDYAHKQRLISVPQGETMQYIDDGFPDFPDGTVIAKTFYYNNDDRDPSLGRTIIETRVLIKTNGEWELGEYHWNSEQTDAVLSTDAVDYPISFINEDGETIDVDYVIPSATDCFTCHNNGGDETPIGPRLRTMNMNNQLQQLIDANLLTGVTDVSSIAQLPDWEDTSYTMEERSRAYFDVNCAHCHTDGGFCEIQSTLRLSYETPFDDTDIFNRRFSIINRMQTFQQGFSMPYIGVTRVHTEGFELIESYLNSLD